MPFKKSFDKNDAIVMACTLESSDTLDSWYKVPPKWKRRRTRQRPICHWKNIGEEGYVVLL